MKSIVIIGAGGFGREVAWIAETAGFEVKGFCDDAIVETNRAFLGTIENAAQTIPVAEFIVAVGNNAARKSLFQRAVDSGWTPVSVISPHAVIAPDAIIGKGVFVGHNAVISVNTVIGDGVIINNSAGIGHDVNIADFAQICPGALISGGCKIGESALLGTNSSMIPMKKIGMNATLGAGATAIRDINDGETLVRLR